MSQQTLTRREKQRHTRKCLLEAAAQIFSKQGLERTSIDQVAQTAGYTKGAFYANFKSKEELFLVMLDERFSGELERLDAALVGSHDAQEEAMAAAADFIHFAGDDDWPRLYFQFVAHAAQDDEFRQELATRMAAMRQRVGGIFKRWKESYDIPPALPIEQITAMICFMADGFLVDRMIEPELSEELYTTMVGVFLRGLKAMAEESPAAG
ncbi:MAG TPA: TetR/AcrR family transcriptional regulator [Solirubrobacteraceae bacterium]|nr:TetR/AcrR family transcriptional regulator [Solirubrobacteraceae bacterium]